MRKLMTIGAVTLACSLSFAGPNKREATLRKVEVAAPTVGHVAGASADTPDNERTVKNEPVQQAVQPLSGAMMAIVERQMRKNLDSVDKCLSQPAGGTGSLSVQVKVQKRKVVHASIVDDTIHAQKLNTCLVAAAQTWAFTLDNLEFAWPITVGK